MKTLNPTGKLFFFLAAILWAFDANSQTFQNLSFENANPVSIPNSSLFPFAVTFQSAFPGGWMGYLGTTRTEQALYNMEFIGTATIDIIGPAFGSGMIDGNFTAVLQPGASDQGPVGASIAQTGTIPLGIESLQFRAYGVGPEQPFSVTFGGNNLVPVQLSTGQGPQGQGYTVYGADISAYAGQTGLLEFTADPGTFAMGLDDIVLSTTAVVPEPEPVVLMSAAGLAFAFCRRILRRRP